MLLRLRLLANLLRCSFLGIALSTYAGTHYHKDLYQTLDFFKSQLEQGSDPASWLVVIDVDDVLVKYDNIPLVDGKPAKVDQEGHYEKNSKFVSKEGSLELIEYLIKNKVKFVISSAHPFLDETVKKISDIRVLPLLEKLGYSFESLPKDPELTELPFAKGKYFQYRAGNISGVAETSDYFYSRKAFSVHGVFNNKELEKVSHAVLVDDSMNNHSLFLKDIFQVLPHISRQHGVESIVISRSAPPGPVSPLIYHRQDVAKQQRDKFFKNAVLAQDPSDKKPCDPGLSDPKPVHQIMEDSRKVFQLQH